MVDYQDDDFYVCEVDLALKTKRENKMKGYYEVAECYYEHNVKIQNVRADNDIDEVKITYFCKINLTYELKEVDFEEI